MKDSIVSRKIKKIGAVLTILAFGFTVQACEIPKDIDIPLDKFEKVLDSDEIDETAREWDEFFHRDDEGEDADDTKPQDSEEIGNAENEDPADLKELKNVKTILLCGVDSRKDNFDGRTDTMILISINNDTKKVLMTSVLRDIYAEIPGYGSNRMNAANVFGGMDLLKETVKQNFDINVDNTVVVNFFTVRDAVDSVGGIELELTADEIAIMNGYLVSQNENFGNEPGTDIMEEKTGTYLVNGNQALAYARIRYIGTDFQRTERQRTVIKAVVSKIKAGGLKTAAKFTSEFTDKVKSDMSILDVLSFLFTLSDLSDFKVSTFTIPMDGSWQSVNIDGMSVLEIDFKENADEWYRLVTEP